MTLTSVTLIAALIQTTMPFLIMFSFIVTTPNICKDVVLEKEKRLKVRVLEGGMRTQ